MDKKILIDEPRELVQNDLITTLEKMSKEYTISFDFNYTGGIGHGRGNIIHFTRGREDFVGGAIPSVSRGDESSFTICSYVNGERFLAEVHVNESTWHKIEIGQEKVEEIYQYFVRLDGTEIGRMENSTPQEFEDVKVYASNPWSFVQPGHIRNFYIILNQEIDPIVSNQEIDPKLKCTVCEDIFTDPQMLYCMHTFCSKCVQTLLCDDSLGVVTCPLCMHKSQIGENQELLWKNHFIQEEVLEHFRTCKDLRCIECETETCVKYCCDCKIRLCELCTQHHMRCARNVGHKVVNIGDIPEDTLLEREVTMCVMHKKCVTYYCDHCESLCCIDCTHSSMHKGHSFTLIEELVEGQRAALENLISDCKSKSQEYGDVYLRGAEQFMVGAEEKNKTSVGTVEDTYDTLISILQAGKETQLKLLDESYLSSKSSLGNARERLSILKTTIEYLERVMLLPKGSVTDALSEGSKRLQENLQQITDVLEKNHSELDNVFEFKAEVCGVAEDAESNSDDIKTKLQQIEFTEHNICYEYVAH